MTGTQHGTARTPLTAQAAQAAGQTHGGGVLDAGYKSASASERREATNTKRSADLLSQVGAQEHQERQRSVQRRALNMCPSLIHQHLLDVSVSTSRSNVVCVRPHLCPSHTGRHDAEERPR